ncbi:MAG: P13 family porin [Myxococcales bacterium]|nr:P13 family porin [Myxococcales bacterium]MCB9643103.1 P13 family porin [Myxococcales bacterium]
MKSKKLLVQVGLVFCSLVLGGSAWAGRSLDDSRQGDGWEKAGRHAFRETPKRKKVARVRYVDDRDDSPGVRVYEKRGGDYVYERRESVEYRQDVVPSSGRVGLAGPLLLNIFLPFAIGSWVAGDYVGGGISLGMQLVGGLLVAWSGWGALMTLAGWITGIVMVILHVNNVNARVERADRSRYRRNTRPRFRDDSIPRERRSFEQGATLMKFSF